MEGKGRKLRGGEGMGWELRGEGMGVEEDGGEWSGERTYIVLSADTRCC